MSSEDRLTPAVERLVAAFAEAGVRYAVIGGTAVILRGYDRVTADVDAVALNLDGQVGDLLDLLRRHGLQPRTADAVAFARRTRMILLQDPQGTGIDISMGFLPFEVETVDRATVEQVAPGVLASIATPEDLIIMKLVAARERDLVDVHSLLELYPDLDRARIQAIVTEYAEALESPEIIETLRRILGPS